MSLERGDDARKERKAFFKGAALGASMLAGGMAGGYEGVTEGLEHMNARILSPAVIHELQTDFGATDADILNLEQALRPLVLQELTRQMKRR
jgi:hypothetical protein